ncbi:MAG: hypothetical protein AUK31_05595 [Fibrobacteres bacterium CG2_30_45_31]|nr:MAG: hypothetical protein AUK31_05595 [Fibrobacteres bacterium CG2_30_45_31]
MEVTLTNLSVIVGFFTLVQSIIAFFVNSVSEHKKLQLKIMQNCIEQYRKFADNDNVSEKEIQAYLGLINEEIYYLRKKLVPKDIGNEWLINMINYLPLFSSEDGKKTDFENPVNREILQKRKSIFMDKDQMNKLIPYPRIMELIVLRKGIKKIEVSTKLSEEYENYETITAWKKEVLEELLKNVKKVSPKNRSGLVS